jgi:hypothetical protein
MYTYTHPQIGSGALALSFRDQLNMGLGGLSAAGLVGFCATADPTLGALCLTTGVLSSGVLGLHMTQVCNPPTLY